MSKRIQANQIKKVTKTAPKKLTKHAQQTKDVMDTFANWMEAQGYVDTLDEESKEWKQLTTQVSGLFKAAKTTKPKDPNAPKKGKSAYIFFTLDERAVVKEDLGSDATQKDVMSEMGSRWNELKESDDPDDQERFQRYEQMAKDDKARYEEEKENYVPPTEEELAALAEEKKARKSAAKDPNAPKKGKSAWQFFSSEMRKEIREEFGGKKADAKEVSDELSARWNELKEDPDRRDELQEYEQQAAEDKARYEAEMKEYEANKALEQELGDEDDEKVPKRKIKPRSGNFKTKPSGNKLFMQENRSKFKKANPHLTSTEVTKELSNMWKDLPEEERQAWQEAAEANSE